MKIYDYSDRDPFEITNPCILLSFSREEAKNIKKHLKQVLKTSDEKIIQFPLTDFSQDINVQKELELCNLDKYTRKLDEHLNM